MSEALTNIVGLSVALKIPQGWLAAEADAGRIPYLHIGEQRLFNVDAVRRALAERAASFPERQKLLNKR